ncbi:MAG: hypothetical protein ACKVPY_06735 [Paracoccaceae bacterium]
MGYLIAVLAAGLAIAFGASLRRAMAARAAARARAFDQLARRFDAFESRLQPTGFPRATATLAADAFDLQLVPDALAFRKLPALWLMVSLPAPLPLRATLDILARPSGLETFSGHAALPVTLPTPAFLPPGTAVRSDGEGGGVPETLVERHAGLFADARVKELVISPKGLRIVTLLEEADRTRYLLYRDAELGRAPVAPERVLPLCAALAALRDDILTEARQAA